MCLQARDWETSYHTAQEWVMYGGGAWFPDAWLLQACGAVLHHQPRMAIQVLDQALRHWIAAPADRAVLLWARGSLQLRQVKDPVGAASDFTAAAGAAPPWLRPLLVRDQVHGAAAASRSPQREVTSAPHFEVMTSNRATVAPADPNRRPGAQPRIWPQVASLLTAS